ncbi:polysaccharide pyruvyl transferase family protein [Flammeovirga sp. MY04]|nr:polysaccharide pyruvyl transferase family protein [Flammeovirga sp. MY04]ANQ47877.1 polysaccharide pyruvyl transferase family protein [Flammeovirga sp. MY04]
MIQILIKIKENLKLLQRPVLVNAFVYHKKGKVISENWGDDINYFFLREIIKRPITVFNQYSLAYRLNLKNYLVIGSVIDMLSRKNTEIWGAGIIDEKNVLSIKPNKVYAVRGPLTRKKLLEQGVKCPEVYGDPALLIPLHYKPSVKKEYSIGFIPHRSNLERIDDFTIDGVQISERQDILVIDLSNYKKWTDIIDQICSCENIISASLHGLIMAEAYKIPNVWVEFGKPLIGGHFKFHDFFLSIRRDRETPFIIDNYEFPLKDIQKELLSWQPGYIDLQPLIDSAPFPINLL